MNLEAVGQTFGPFTIDHREHDLMLYALAVGSGPEELPLLYEKNGPRALPTFNVPAAFRAACELLRRLGIGEEPMLHPEHALRIFGPCRAGGIHHDAHLDRWQPARGERRDHEGQGGALRRRRRHRDVTPRYGRPSRTRWAGGSPSWPRMSSERSWQAALRFRVR